jgi:hypothetical protein
MRNALHMALCVGVPVLASIFFAYWSRNNLEEKPMIVMSATALKVFLISRLLFHIAFGILIVTFLFAIVYFDMTGEQTRLLIATSPTTANVPTQILSGWSNVLLPVIFLAIFVSLFTLGVIGRRVIKLMPTDAKPGVEFSGFRFTFLMMAMSLIIPPLIFGSLLML